MSYMNELPIDIDVHIQRSSGYPSHLTRYSFTPLETLSAKIPSRGYSSLCSLGTVEFTDNDESSSLAFRDMKRPEAGMMGKTKVEILLLNVDVSE